MKKRKIAFLSCIAILTASTVSYASFIIDEKSSINNINVSAGDVTISNKFVNNYPMYFYLNSTDRVLDYNAGSTDNDKFLFDIVSYNPGTPLISATGNYDGGNLISIDYCLKFYLDVNTLIQSTNIYGYEFLDELECKSLGYDVKFNRSKYYFVEFAISFDNVSDFTKKIDATNCYISCPGISSIIGEDTTDSSQLALKNHHIYPFNPIVLAGETESINKYSATQSTDSASASMKFAYRSDPTVNFLDPNYFFYFVKQLEDYGFFESSNLGVDKLKKLEFEAHFIVNVDADYANWAYNPKFTIQFTDYLEQKKTTGGNS